MRTQVMDEQSHDILSPYQMRPSEHTTTTQKWWLKRLMQGPAMLQVQSLMDPVLGTAIVPAFARLNVSVAETAKDFEGDACVASRARRALEHNKASHHPLSKFYVEV
ncbi:hypothetical protein IFM89_037014 [Coptis chinensis]|uniref:Uncharacterized protein n=1 Tax=Coptis chinensis TaxID=261450 RepID=A0A835LPR8_9MAGN|nr:hypothetical protein IFM89_037014 [Coptis chinensis]